MGGQAGNTPERGDAASGPVHTTGHGSAECTDSELVWCGMEREVLYLDRYVTNRSAALGNTCYGREGYFVTIIPAPHHLRAGENDNRSTLLTPWHLCNEARWYVGIHPF